ncbi:MAG: hypothetical protein U0165_12575 [Polyangiaceae bacterium]
MLALRDCARALVRRVVAFWGGVMVLTLGSFLLGVIAPQMGEANARTSPLSGPAFLAYPAKNTTSHSAIVMLHGMCGAPERECPYYVDAATPYGWLMCPRGNVECSGDGVMWGTSTEAKNKRVETALSALEGKLGAAPRDNVLIGFSQGAFTAVEIAQESSGRYSSMLLIGASITPQASLLKRAGIRRVAFAAGDLDQSKDAMEANARRLAKDGIDTRFFSLGKIGHAYPNDMTERMSMALAWLRE